MHKTTPRHLRYASGYLELGLLNEASEELEKIDVADRSHLDVLLVRLEVHMIAKDWEALVGVAREVTRKRRVLEQGWIYWAFALRELQRIDEAREVLLEAEPIHGKTSAVLHYNLACYSCLLGDLATARERLNRACEMNPEFSQTALEDFDLAGLLRAK